MRYNQCSSKDLLKDLQCQGAKSHDGPHWAYDAAGFLIQWKNRRDKSSSWKNVGCSWTPPDHKSYIHPKKMNEKHFLTLWSKKKKNM